MSVPEIIGGPRDKEIIAQASVLGFNLTGNDLTANPDVVVKFLRSMLRHATRVPPVDDSPREVAALISARFKELGIDEE